MASECPRKIRPGESPWHALSRVFGYSPAVGEAEVVSLGRLRCPYCGRVAETFAFREVETGVVLVPVVHN